VDMDVDTGPGFWTTYIAGHISGGGGYLIRSRTNGGGWVTLGGRHGIRVSSNAGSAGTWMIQDDGDIYRWNGSSWTLQPGCATDIAVGADNTVWTLGCSSVSGGNHKLNKWNGSAWVQDSSSGAYGVRLSVGRKRGSTSTTTAPSVPWIVRADGSIFRRSANSTSSSGTWEQLPGAATDIAANAAGYPWAISNSPIPGGFRIMVFNEQDAGPGGPAARQRNEWRTVPGGAVNIATSEDGDPLVINASNILYSSVN
jgi:hypothetical protein